MNFVKFRTAVANTFKSMGSDLLYVDVDRDEIWNTYLKAFPEGSDPIYKKRTQHDCSCCKSFIRQVGGVVAFKDGRLVTIWDGEIKDEPEYQIVSEALSKYVRSRVIAGRFYTTERKFGIEKNFENAGGTQLVQHDHFYLTMPETVVLRSTQVGPKQNEFTSTHQVMSRGLKELSVDSLETVLELINQNSIYRGSEYRFMVEEFLKLKKAFDRSKNQEHFTWEKTFSVNASVARINNSAIGTLLNDLTGGMDLESAVKRFEAVVAPANYKRPTALVTQKMIDKAKATVESLGLMSAFQRRFANLTDLSINDVLFADRSIKQDLSGNVFSDLGATASSAPKKLDKIQDVPIETFIKEYLPTASSIELLLEPKHSNNFVSLITSDDPTAKQIFKWSNQFSWSYRGEVTDAIKERVKAAGGNVTGDVCCRLAWYNYDDLDFHMVEPDGYEIEFRNKRMMSPCRGMLDVDMNAGGGTTRTPVENIVYDKATAMQKGEYVLKVHNWSSRDPKDKGFAVQIDVFGEVHTFEFEHSPRDQVYQTIATIVSDGKGNITVKGSPKTKTGKTVWGVKSGEFVKVHAMMLSPNFWQQSVGNKHYFFMLDGCKNDESARGFYNEFLSAELNEHRKVFELLASKNKPTQTENQLSGVGFSSTIANKVTCRVTGKTARLVNIVF